MNIKSLPIIIVLLFFSFSSFSKDVITLAEGYSYEGEVYKTTKRYLRFKAENGEKYKIPLGLVYGVEFENSKSKEAIQFTEKVVKFLEDHDKNMPYAQKKLMANRDAKNHGRGFGYVFAGFMLGPFGYLFLIGDSKFSPNNADHAERFIDNRDLNDYQYIEMYSRKVRTKQAWNVTIGWAASILFLTLVSA